MKTSKFLLSTLVAAAAMTSSAYAAQITNFDFSGDTSGHLGSGAVSNISDDFVFGDGNITVTIDNGWQAGNVTLSGAWTGNGTFKATDKQNTSQGQDFVLVGDMSGFSGNINIFQGYYNEDGGTAALGGGNSTILQFGNENSYKATASAETINLFKDQSNVTVSTVAILRYNYSGAGSDGNSKLGINSSSISARYLEFKGGADYVVDSIVTGNNATASASNNTLKISAGSVTFNGAVSNFGNLNVVAGATATFAGTAADFTNATIAGAVAVAEGGSLTLDGTVSLSSAIQNSGTVTIAAGTVFDVSADANTTYELVSSGGTIKLGATETAWTELTKDTYSDYFTLSGVEIASRDSLDFSTAGTVVLTKGSLSLVWGSATSGTWNTTSTNTPWLNGTDASDFQNEDSVTFGTEEAQITVEGTVAPGAMAVDADTVLTGSGTVSVSDSSKISFSDDAKLTINTSVVLDVGTVTDMSDLDSIIGDGTISLPAENKEITLSKDFKGTLEIIGSDAANQINLGVGDLGGTTKIILDGVYIWSGAQKEFGQEVVVRGSYVGYGGDGVTSYMRNALRGPSAKFTFDKFVLADGASFGIEEGEAIFNSLDGENGALYVSGGTVNISGTETNTLGTLNITGGTTTISGTGTNTITTLNASGGTTNISGTGTNTITTLNASGGTTNISGTVGLTRMAVLGGTVEVSSGTTSVSKDVEVNGSNRGSVGTCIRGGSLSVNGGILKTCYLALNDGAASDVASSVTLSEGEILITGGDTADPLGAYDGGLARFIIGHWGGSATHSVTLSGGVLNAVNAYARISWTSKGEMTVSGGEANLYGLDLAGQDNTRSATFEMSSGRVNLGAGGIKSADNAAKVIQLTGGTLGALESWSSSAKIQLGGRVTIDTTDLKVEEDGGSAVEEEGGIPLTVGLSGQLSGDGSLIKDGVGTLTLSGTNTYEGGTTISDGTLIAGSASALGDGAVTVSGGQLNVNNVTISNAINIVLAEGRYAESTKAAITGTEVGKSSVTEAITVSIADQLALETLVEGSYYLWDKENVTVSSNVTYNFEGLEGYNYSVTDGLLTFSAIPEPSAFGLLAGVGALALVAARRRRRK